MQHGFFRLSAFGFVANVMEPHTVWNALSVPGISIERPQNLTVNPLGFKWETVSALTTFGWVQHPPLTDWPQKIRKSHGFFQETLTMFNDVLLFFFRVFSMIFWSFDTFNFKRNIQHLEFQPLDVFEAKGFMLSRQLWVRTQQSLNGSLPQANATS